MFELKDDRCSLSAGRPQAGLRKTRCAWTCLAEAIHNYGKPLMVLSDNSLAFTGRKLGSVVLFEKNLVRLRIKPIWAASHHPQTCGKNERGHRTARHWLSRRPPAASVEQLQQLLTTTVGLNNGPIEAWAAPPDGARRAGACAKNTARC